jgi:hypothetical protein
MKSTRRRASHIRLDYEKNLDITRELYVYIQQIMKFVENYRSNWKNHVLQTTCSRVTASPNAPLPTKWLHIFGRPNRHCHQTITAK